MTGRWETVFEIRRYFRVYRRVALLPANSPDDDRVTVTTVMLFQPDFGFIDRATPSTGPHTAVQRMPRPQTRNHEAPSNVPVETKNAKCSPTTASVARTFLSGKSVSNRPTCIRLTKYVWCVHHCKKMRAVNTNL